MLISSYFGLVSLISFYLTTFVHKISINNLFLCHFYHSRGKQCFICIYIIEGINLVIMSFTLYQMVHEHWWTLTPFWHDIYDHLISTFILFLSLCGWSSCVHSIILYIIKGSRNYLFTNSRNTQICEAKYRILKQKTYILLQACLLV